MLSVLITWFWIFGYDDDVFFVAVDVAIDNPILCHGEISLFLSKYNNYEWFRPFHSAVYCMTNPSFEITGFQHIIKIKQQNEIQISTETTTNSGPQHEIYN